MKIYTSNFAKSSRDPRAVAICRGVPSWYTGRKMIELAPPWDLLAPPWDLRDRISTDEFKARYYREILEKLNPYVILNDIGDGAVMLCWEKEGDFCHRHVVAEWLSMTGCEVSEITKNSKEPKEAEQLFFL